MPHHCPRRQPQCLGLEAAHRGGEASGIPRTVNCGPGRERGRAGSAGGAMRPHVPQQRAEGGASSFLRRWACVHVRSWTPGSIGIMDGGGRCRNALCSGPPPANSYQPPLCALDWLALRGQAAAAIRHRLQSGAISRNGSQSAICQLNQGPRCPLPPLPLPRRPWRLWWPARELARTLAAQIYFRPSASSAFRTAGRSRMRRYQALRCSKPSKRMPAL